MLPRSFLLVQIVLLLTTATSAPCANSSTLLERGWVPVVGSNQVIFTGKDDTLIQLARANGLGYQSLADANPGVDPWLPGAGRPLLLPYSAVLPDRPQTGITVNLAELRLYLVWEEAGLLQVRIYPIGIGDEGWETPEGTFNVLRKVEQPVWNPPQSIRQERPELPLRVPPGPENPLGDYWLAFTPQGHGIHGTHSFGGRRSAADACGSTRGHPRPVWPADVDAGAVMYKPPGWWGEGRNSYIEAHRDYRQVITDPKEIVRSGRMVR
jgi:L,D-transpeptidase ErfK/SrfK